MTQGGSVVTGAFGYTGRHIAGRLLDRGVRVRTLTNRPDRPNPFGDRVGAAPFDFGNPSRMAEAMAGAEVLYNTYWIRFPHRGLTYDHAVANIEALVAAARTAGVRRIVHVSITNASATSPLPYFKGKAMAERAVMESGISYGIVRPTVVFGNEDILINNIAWFLRRFPLFPIYGGGDYPVQPVFVDDLADLAIEVGQGSDNRVLDAAGPETLSYEEMVRLIGKVVGGRSKLVRVPASVCMLLGRPMDWILRDVVITRDEIDGLMAGLLVSDGPATCATSFAAWLEENAGRLGRRYRSELRRHYR